MNFALISLGCSKNLVDSENLTGILVNRKGYRLTANIEEADFVLVNTCGFIGDAKEESIQAILQAAEFKKDRLQKIVVCGCLAQRYAEELLDAIPEIDAIVGTGEIDKIEEVIDLMFQGESPVETENFTYLPNAETDRVLTTPPHTAYLKISEGCDRRCTYCIIPKLRGKLRSRTKEDIVEEAKKLAKSGVRELNLLAQETTEYGIDRYGEKSLAKLLKELVKVDGIDWIRSYYMFPNSVTEELIEVIKTEDKICKYFDIPIQHISTQMLRRMGRAITGEKTKELLHRIRREVPEAVFRTSLIVGFPGETEEDFEELRDFVEEFKFDYIGVFQYSREEDTAAYGMDAQVPDEVKQARQAELLNLQGQIVEEKNREMLGKEVELLIDGVSSESEYMLEGRLRGQAFDIDGKVLTTEGTAEVGELVKVVLDQNFEYDYTGRIIKNEK